MPFSKSTALSYLNVSAAQQIMSKAFWPCSSRLAVNVLLFKAPFNMLFFKAAAQASALGAAVGARLEGSLGNKFFLQALLFNTLELKGFVGCSRW